MSKLQKVNFWSTKIGDPVVEAVANIDSVTWLNIDKTAVTDASLKMLEEMPQLTWLHCGSNKKRLTDAGAESLKKLKKLKYLNISKNDISEDMFYDLDDLISPGGGTVVW